MASESTAIHDLLAGLQRKPLPQEPDDDLLFAGSRPDPRDSAPLGRLARGTQPPPRMFEPYTSQAMPAAAQPLGAIQQVVPLPQPFMRMPAHALASHASMHRVSELSSKKIYVLAGGLFIVVGVLLGMYLSGGDASASAAENRVTMPVVAAAEPAPAEQPVAVVAAPIEPAPASAPVAPMVTPIEPITSPELVVEPTRSAAIVTSDELSVPPPVVPASAFEARHEPTLPTIPTIAPSPIKQPAPAVVAAAPPRATPATKKSRRQLAREQRATKRANKRAAATTSVARAEPAPRTQKATPDTKLDGNGALAITSAEPREVWVDGRNSRRMTPLRVLLKPGKHKVTLFDKSRGTAKTYDVEIKANETTKLAK